MVDKLVTHLKNIIFFKAVIYVVLMIILFILMPILKEDLAKAVRRKQESQAFLKAEKVKLKSIIDFEDKILGTNVKYMKLINNASSTSYFERTTLINYMSLLSKKHKLFEPIKVRVIRNFDTNNTPNTIGYIQIHYYDVGIKFKTSDYHSLLTIIREICLLLPPGAVVQRTKIQQSQVLTPKIITKLNPESSPGLMNAEIRVQLREIVHEK